MSGDTAVPAPERAPGFARHPGYRVDILPCPKRVRVLFGGATLADSIEVKTVLETGITPVYYIPKADIRQDLLSATDRGTYCPFKGSASYWSVAAGGKRSENAVWAYEAPFVEVAGLKDHMAFYWDRMDHWYEEDEEVFVHARDPHVRIDVVASKRPVTVRLGGEAVAESGEALFLFETGLPTRYYLPRADVRAGILRPSDLRTACPYKGAPPITRSKSAAKSTRTWSGTTPIRSPRSAASRTASASSTRRSKPSWSTAWRSPAPRPSGPERHPLRPWVKSLNQVPQSSPSIKPMGRGTPALARLAKTRLKFTGYRLPRNQAVTTVFQPAGRPARRLSVSSGPCDHPREIETRLGQRHA